MEEEREPEQDRVEPIQFQRATLPPGCRFYPSEELLLRYYLTIKNSTGDRNRDFDGSDLIRELDLYDYDPFELPEDACFAYGYGGRKRHWYCYTTVRVSKDAWRRRRKVKSGFWIRKGSVRNVLSGNGANREVLGTRTKFVFYLGNSRKRAIRTDWVLYEYALLDHLVASFVLCRVVIKPRYKNSASEIGLSCCAEESVSAVRHIGIQHDENVRSDIVEAKVCDDSFIDRKNENSAHPQRCAGENNDHVRDAHVPAVATTFQLSVGPQGNQQLSIANFYISSNLTSSQKWAYQYWESISFLSFQLPFFHLLNFAAHPCDGLFLLRLHAFYFW